jgi:putative ABC transport system permease protein
METPAGASSQQNANHQDRHKSAMVETFLNDLRFGLRLLYKYPSFSVILVLTLALGIGANTAIFSVIDTVLLRPLPYKDPNHLALLTEYNSTTSLANAGVSYPDYLTWAQQNKSFEEMAAYWNVSGDGAVIGGLDSTQRVGATIVSNSFFPILGIKPTLGRSFLPDEEKPSAAKVFMMSDGLWRRSLAADPKVIGKTFVVDDEQYTLVGILPRGFQFPENCDLWLSAGTLSSMQMDDHVSHPFWVLGRLRKGTNLREAQSELDRIQHQLGLAFPKTDANLRVHIKPLLDQYVGSVRKSLLLIFATVGFVLLIACANVVNLLLARASVREREFAVRACLGAGRWRLIQQALTENFLIVCISGVLALVVAKLALAAIVMVGAGSIPRMDSSGLSSSVLIFTGVLIVIVTFMVGLAPAFAGSSGNYQEVMREGPRGGTVDLHSRRLRGVLVVFEVAFTFLLLYGTGLMVKSFILLNNVDPGFTPTNLVAMKITVPGMRYPKPDERKALLRQVLEGVQALPGVKSAAATTALPLSGDTAWGSINIEGSPVKDWSEAFTVEGRGVSASYFRTMGIPLVRGRIWLNDDDQEVSRVIIINQAMADKFWPGKDPIGQHITSLGRDRTPREIIGIVGNVKDFGLDADSEPVMYRPYGWWPSMNLVVSSTLAPSDVVAAVRHMTAGLDKDAPIYQVTTLDQLVAQSKVSWRFNVFLLGLFAFLALSLAAVGIYGVLAFSVSQRKREIGIRLALGALRTDILRLIVWQGLQLVLIGLTLGMIASFFLMRVMNTLLYHVGTFEVLPLVSVAGLLALVGVLASYFPGQRAMGVDPMVALRYE